MSEVNSCNPELSTKSIELSDHAFQRTKERFNISHRVQALGHFRGLLRQAHYIGKVTSEDGNDSILYAYGRTAIYLSLDRKTIITVNRFENVTCPRIKNKVLQIHSKEFNKLDRLENSRVKKLQEDKLKFAIECAQLEYRYLKTRSKNVREYCKNRKLEINNIITTMEKEILELKANKRQVANSMVSVL